MYQEYVTTRQEKVNNNYKLNIETTIVFSNITHVLLNKLMRIVNILLTHANSNVIDKKVLLTAAKLLINLDSYTSRQLDETMELVEEQNELLNDNMMKLSIVKTRKDDANVVVILNFIIDDLIKQSDKIAEKHNRKELIPLDIRSVIINYIDYRKLFTNVVITPGTIGKINKPIELSKPSEIQTYKRKSPKKINKK
jgi:hypothetical protein